MLPSTQRRTDGQTDLKQTYISTEQILSEWLTNSTASLPAMSVLCVRAEGKARFVTCSDHLLTKIQPWVRFRFYCLVRWWCGNVNRFSEIDRNDNSVSGRKQNKWCPDVSLVSTADCFVPSVGPGKRSTVLLMWRLILGNVHLTFSMSVNGVALEVISQWRGNRWHCADEHSFKSLHLCIMHMGRKWPALHKPCRQCLFNSAQAVHAPALHYLCGLEGM